MTTQLTTQEARFTPDQVRLLKDTVCKGATDDEFKIFCYAVQRTGLDPFMKQIHAVKRWNSKTNKEDMSIQVGIDGFRLLADRTGTYAGNEEPVFDDEKLPRKATVTVYKMIQGQRCPFTATARWDEYYPGDKQGFMWKKMPCVMLGKVAESLALRKAFPADLSGLYTPEEMAQSHKEHIVHNVSHWQMSTEDAAELKEALDDLGWDKKRLVIETQSLYPQAFKNVDQFHSLMEFLVNKAAKKSIEAEKPVVDPEWEQAVMDTIDPRSGLK